MVAIAQSQYMVTMPSLQFDILKAISKTFKWVVTPMQEKTGMERALDDVKYGRVSVLHTPKN